MSLPTASARASPLTVRLAFLGLVAGYAMAVTQLAGAETITLHPVADTTLSQAFPGHNFGAMFFFNSGTTQNGTTNRGLLKFDLASQLPPDSQILSAKLTLEVVGQPNEDFPAARFNLHRMLRPWGEGRGTNTPGGAGQGSAAYPDEANWTQPFAFTSEFWSAPGAAMTSDFRPEISAGVTVGGVDQSPYEILGSARMIADLQLWLDEPATNHGWLLHCQQEATRFTARRFASREDEFNTPRLELGSLVRPRILVSEKLGKRFHFQFRTHAGQSYRVEFHDFGAETAWQPLTNYGLATTSQVFTCSDVLTIAQRVYRVVTE